MYESVIQSDSGVLEVYLRGYQSGFGATIICEAGDSCDIFCFHNGCQMLYLECEQNSVCNITLNNNDSAITIPAIQNRNEYDYSVFDGAFSTLSNDELCNNALNFVFDNYLERTQIIENSGPVCCRGDQSCKNAESNFQQSIQH